MFEKIIENPGAGDCAFYAFAIGLIHIIQQEHGKGQTTMFERWKTLAPCVGSLLRDIQHFNMDAPAYRQKKLLDTLQHSLRAIAFQARVNELRQACALARDDDYAPLLCARSYCDFAGLYFDKTEGSYLEYATEEIKQKLRELGALEFSVAHRSLIPLMISLLYGDEATLNSVTAETKPQQDSLIIKAIERVTQDGIWWGTSGNLNDLATIFGVHLNIWIGGKKPYDFSRDTLGQPTVQLNNIGASQPGHGYGQYSGGYHWNTIIPSESSKDYPSRGMSVTSSVLNAPAREGSTRRRPEGLLPFQPTGLASPSSKLVRSKILFWGVGSQRSMPTAKTPIKKAKTSDALFEGTSPLSAFIQNSTQRANKFVMQQIKQNILNAQVEYCDYSEKIWFSLFHRHGTTGRKRAQKFNQEIQKLENYDEIKEKIFSYLENKKNGNTHPHSFRTMLLSRLLMPDDDEKSSFAETSKKFDTKLQELHQKLPVYLPSSHFAM